MPDAEPAEELLRAGESARRPHVAEVQREILRDVLRVFKVALRVSHVTQSQSQLVFFSTSNALRFKRFLANLLNSISVVLGWRPKLTRSLHRSEQSWQQTAQHCSQASMARGAAVTMRMSKFKAAREAKVARSGRSTTRLIFAQPLQRQC